VLTADDIEGFRGGDPDAIRHVYREYGRLVFAVARKMLASRELAEEATQQTFVKAWQAAASFDASRALGPWLTTIARRTCIDLHRRETRRATSNLDDVTAAHPALVTVGPDVGQSYDAWVVRQAIDELPDDERAIVRMQHVDELSHAEIADKLGVPLGTVKSRSFRAHRRLAAALGHLRQPAGDGELDQPARPTAPPFAEPSADGRRTLGRPVNP
jgi:RNA polymerase sigma-70 factor (ECF subfamily)